MAIRILKSAEYELDDAIAYHENQVEGLGIKFLNDILAVFKRINANPKAWSPFSYRTRRCMASRFPYGVIYQIREKEILIVAIAHLHRKPEYWKKRID